jgi:RNA polymerase sigma factor for flagellar operon FliA
MEEKTAGYRALVQHFSSQLDTLAIAGLPCYEGHGRAVILVDDHNLHLAVHELLQERYLGFDTESKPTFQKGEVSSGIAIMQISSPTTCYIFQMRRIGDATALGEIIGQPQIIKIGVGLKDDLNKLRSRYKFHPNAFVDLGLIFRAFGRRNSIGSKQLVALVLKQRLRKSKSATTSNWAAERLSPLQIEYASDDAFSSVDAYLRLRELFAPYTALLDKGVAKLLDL